MYGTKVHPVNIAYVTMMIAMSTRSAAIAEIAYAMYGVATNKPWLPEKPECADMAARIVRKIWDREWNRRARVAFANPEVQYLGDVLSQQYSKFVPFTPHDMTAMSMRMEAFYQEQPAIRLIAKVFLEQLDLPEVEPPPALRKDIPNDRVLLFLKASVLLKPTVDRRIAYNAMIAAKRAQASPPAPIAAPAPPMATLPNITPSQPAAAMPSQPATHVNASSANALRYLQAWGILQAFAEQRAAQESSVPRPVTLMDVHRFVTQIWVGNANGQPQGLSPPS